MVAIVRIEEGEEELIMSKNTLQELHDAGQSIWLDSIDRTMIHDGELERRIREDALTGRPIEGHIHRRHCERKRPVRRR